MNNVTAPDVVASPEFTVDEEAMHLLEADLAANQSVRSVKTPIKLFIDDLSNKLFKNTVSTVAVITVMLGCCAVIYWNLVMRMPNPETQLTLESENNAMKERLDTLLNKISTIDYTDLDKKLEVESSRVFSGYSNLAIWINELVQNAEMLDLNIAYYIEDASVAPVEGVLKVPVVFKLSPAPGEAISVFKNSMSLFNKMLADPWHIDIISAQARGESNGITNVDVTIHVWLADSDDYARIRIENESTQIADIDSDEEFIQ